MKEPEYNPKHSFQGYVKYLKENLKRDLTESEIKLILQAYITPISVDEMLAKLKEG